MANPTVRSLNTTPRRSGTMIAPFVAGALLMVVIGTASPVFAQRCTTQNGQTICCDSSGNCYRK